jgi:hypothetical protein
MDFKVFGLLPFVKYPSKRKDVDNSDVELIQEAEFLL